MSTSPMRAFSFKTLNAFAVLSLTLSACGRSSAGTDSAAQTTPTSESAQQTSVPVATVGANSDATAASADRAGVRALSDVAVVSPADSNSVANNVAVQQTANTQPPATAPQPQVANNTVTSYEVKPGDTLSVIAEKNGVSIDAIASANSVIDIHKIKPGQKLSIPAPASN